MVQTLPYGSWPSPISAEALVADAAAPGMVRTAGDALWWAEMRPQDGGRYQLVRMVGDGPAVDQLPAGWSARTRVHEYGGGAFWLTPAGAAVFARWDDQRLYVLEPGHEPVAVTPEPPARHAWRYADGTVHPGGRWTVCVRERHDDDGVHNEVVAVDLTGQRQTTVLASGRDFVAAPRISRDGKQLAWLTWDHPQMPWDGTELWVAGLDIDGGTVSVHGARREAGSTDESLIQPQWGRHGQLFVLSDRSDWWNLYRVDGTDVLTPVHPMATEVGGPMWVFGLSSYVVTRDGHLVLASEHEGSARLTIVDGEQLSSDPGAPTAAAAHHVLPFSSIRSLTLGDGRLGFTGERTDGEAVVATIALGIDAAPGPVTIVRPARVLPFDQALFARPLAITFPSTGGRLAHAWFYAPTNPDVVAPAGERPPLLVLSHGGPTSAASTGLDLETQFWTSRGFAVVDVDYGGSTGYGRAYRKLLEGAWGIVDVDDCCAAAQHLAAQDLVDPTRLAIRGGSAGGFTTLACLAFRDVFAAGASHFGVADLAALARDTHKFESRYLDRLVGPWPEAEAVYAARSPINHVDGFDRPLIVLQGLEDEVVPPAQSEMIVAALAAKGVPHAYVPFAGEQHGFRQAPNIMRAVTAELSFYGQVFGFAVGADIEPVEVVFVEKLAGG